MRIQVAASTLLLAVAILPAPAIAAGPHVDLRLEADGSVDLAGEHIADPLKLQSSLAALAAQKPRPEIHIQTDKDVSFEKLGQVILAMQKAGFPRIGFITEPPK